MAAAQWPCFLGKYTIKVYVLQSSRAKQWSKERPWLLVSQLWPDAVQSCCCALCFCSGCCQWLLGPIAAAAGAPSPETACWYGSMILYLYNLLGHGVRLSRFSLPLASGSIVVPRDRAKPSNQAYNELLVLLLLLVLLHAGAAACWCCCILLPHPAAATTPDTRP